MNKVTTSLVILSGGQDSTTALFWAKEQFAEVEAITFDYGQRHRVEVESAKLIARMADVSHRVVTLKGLSELTKNALINKTQIHSETESGLPTTFVPGRNLIFTTYAAAYAYDKGISDLVLGVSAVDYSGYPDCRETTIKSLQKTLSLGMDYKIKIHTPLIHLSKKKTVLLAKKLGIIDLLKHTHTCYKGIKPGCGECPACQLRAKGFEEAGIEDPLFV